MNWLFPNSFTEIFSESDIFSDLFGSAGAEAGSAAANAGTGLNPTADGAAPVMSHWADDRPANHAETVVYLGVNDASREKEKAAFAGNKNATIIDGAGTDEAMQGKVMAADGETVLDLGHEDQLRQYFTEVGVSGVRRGPDGKPIETTKEAMARTSELTDLFLGQDTGMGWRQGGISPGSRDEMAEFLEVLQDVEQGDGFMDRLIMSGHSTGSRVYSEAAGSPGVSFAQMKGLMDLFPKAQGGVEDLMLSACHTLEEGFGTQGGQQYKDIFPNLDTAWGYDGFSPSYKQGSTQHIKNWMKASQGDDNDKVAKEARRTGQNATAMLYDD